MRPQTKKFSLKITSILLSAAFISLPYLCFADIGQHALEIALEGGLPVNTAYGVAANVLMWLLRIFTILAVLSFIISGIMYLFAGADKNLADKAKSGVNYSIMGIAVALSAYVIIILIDSLMAGGDGGL
jgi:hypothetical protein